MTAVAAALIDGGLAPGDRVAVWAPNDCDWVLAALGALSAGGVLVPVSTRFTGPEALDVIGRSGARVLFVAGDFLGVDRLGGAARRRGRPLAVGRGAAGLGSALVVRMPGRLGRVRAAAGRAVPTAVTRRAGRGGAAG